jgi:hypothetical protein
MQARAAFWLRAAREGRIEAVACTHGFAEVWAVLTGVPIEPRLDPSAADRVIERLGGHIRPVALRWTDYRAAMRRCGERGLRSGSVYDALHLCAAERAMAAALLTFNVRHFLGLGAGDRPRIVAPPDPPGPGDILAA